MMYFDNVYRCWPGHIDQRATHFNWNISNTGIFVGIGGWAYEAVGTIFTVKETMKYKSDIRRLIKIVFILVGFLFIMFSLSFNFVKSKIH